jgi:phospholipid/cholesterol/gamma-HCH transport system permease protein
MLSVHPTSYLVLPRLVACLFMLPVLALIGMWSGIFGGMVVAGSAGIPQSTFLDSIRSYVEIWDFAGGLVKAPVFGLIIAIVACQQGLRTKEGAVGVGRATTNSVVISMVLIYITNFLLARVLF